MKTNLLFILLFLFIHSGVVTGADTSHASPIPLLAANDYATPQKQCLFEYIYHLPGTPTIKLNTDLKQLIRNKMQESYQASGFELFSEDGEVLVSLKGKVRARGNMRKQVSYYPPLKIDFKKSDLDRLGFLKIDDLKFVLPNNKNKHNQEKLLQEYLLYQLYQAIDPVGIRAKLIQIEIQNEDGKCNQLAGLLIEDEAAYSNRMKAQVLEDGIVRVSQLDRTAFAKMTFFQYMIANTDYSVVRKHNIKLVQIPGRSRMTALPYDFDYAGFVGHEYATPNPVLPIKDVHTRYFYAHYRLTSEEYDQTKAFFLSIEEKLYQQCEEASYLHPKTIKGCKRYIKSFYKELKRSKSFAKNCIKAMET